MDKPFLDEFLLNEDFSDFFVTGPSRISGFDVIMPIQNTNPFFRRNLVSIFRELPVRRLIIGDGGCTDASLEILSSFPRVLILDHQELKTLGGSLKELIMAVETEKFAYLHSDVYLPHGFFDNLAGIDLSNLWLESNRTSLVVHEDLQDSFFDSDRPYSGAQFGDSALLKQAVSQVQDDYLYRNEDIVIRELVADRGGQYRKVQDLIHLHQSVTKNIENEPALEVQVSRAPDYEWNVRTMMHQYKGIVKYTNPIRDDEVSYLVNQVNLSLRSLDTIGSLNWLEVMEWVQKTNPSWLPFIRRPNNWTVNLTKLTRRLASISSRHLQD